MCDCQLESCYSVKRNKEIRTFVFIYIIAAAPEHIEKLLILWQLAAVTCQEQQLGQTGAVFHRITPRTSIDPGWLRTARSMHEGWNGGTDGSGHIELRPQQLAVVSCNLDVLRMIPSLLHWCFSSCPHQQASRFCSPPVRR